MVISSRPATITRRRQMAALDEDHEEQRGASQQGRLPKGVTGGLF